MQIGPNSFLELLKGRIGTPGFNPNAPDPRLPRGAASTQAPGVPPAQAGNWMDRLNTPMAQIGLNMLAAPRGTPLGQAAGGAVLNYQQQQRMAQEEDLKRKYMEAQIQAMGTPNPSQDPASVREFQYAKENGFQGTFQDWVTRQSKPSDVQSFEFRQGLPPEEQAAWDKAHGREQNPYFQWVQRVLPDGSTQQGTFDARSGQTTWDQSVVPAGKKPEVDAAGAAKGKITAESVADLPRVVDNAIQSSASISNLLNHPDSDKIFGVYGMFPVVPGSGRADAMAMYNQIKGKTFLEAYNTLKGGGQITEVEGKKAEEAIARLDRAQSWSAAKSALIDLQSVIDAGVARAQKKATPEQGSVSGANRIRVDAEGNVIK